MEQGLNSQRAIEVQNHAYTYKVQDQVLYDVSSDKVNGQHTSLV